jgi:hypothetical protein
MVKASFMKPSRSLEKEKKMILGTWLDFNLKFLS